MHSSACSPVDNPAMPLRLKTYNIGSHPLFGSKMLQEIMGLSVTFNGRIPNGGCDAREVTVAVASQTRIINLFTTQAVDGLTALCISTAAEAAASAEAAATAAATASAAASAAARSAAMAVASASATATANATACTQQIDAVMLVVNALLATVQVGV